MLCFKISVKDQNKLLEKPNLQIKNLKRIILIFIPKYNHYQIASQIKDKLQRKVHRKSINPNKKMTVLIKTKMRIKIDLY